MIGAFLLAEKDSLNRFIKADTSKPASLMNILFYERERLRASLRARAHTILTDNKISIFGDVDVQVKLIFMATQDHLQNRLFTSPIIGFGKGGVGNVITMFFGQTIYEIANAFNEQTIFLMKCRMTDSKIFYCDRM